MNWDDARFFLALYRTGAIRAAARNLQVNHATVLRRLNQLEEYLGTRLFERLPNGYAPTPQGQQFAQEAEQMETAWFDAERRLLGGNKALSGTVRITLPEPMGSDLFAADLARFTQQHPDIELELVLSNSLLSLTRREADIALRGVEKPPEHLIGRRFYRYAVAAYATPEYLAERDPQNPEQCHWIGWDDATRSPPWVRETDHANLFTKHRVDEPRFQHQWARAGVGIAMLPCFLGDADDSLIRVPPGRVYYRNPFWLLTHPDLRGIARIRLVMDAMTECLRRQEALIRGDLGVKEEELPAVADVVG